jgi:acyl-coenzyme A thioesterase 13
MGDELELESEVVHAGRRLATIRGTLRRRRDGAVVATAEHGKVSVGEGKM